MPTLKTPARFELIHTVEGARVDELEGYLRYAATRGAEAGWTSIEATREAAYI